VDVRGTSVSALALARLAQVSRTGTYKPVTAYKPVKYKPVKYKPVTYKPVKPC